MSLIAIKAGKLIDGTGAAPLTNATVLIEGSKIKAAGKNVKIPGDAKVIDAAGKTVMPGMIDAHMHFWGTKPTDSYADEVARPREVRLIKAVNDAKHYLQMGFTMVKDCGGMNGIFLKQSVKEGDLTGVPRILATGFPLMPTYGNPFGYIPPQYVDGRTSRNAGQQGGMAIICDGVDRCIEGTRYNLRLGADFAKMWIRGGSEYNIDEIKAVVQTAAEVDKFVTVHSDTDRIAERSIRAGVKTIDHAAGVTEKTVEMGIKADVVFVSTLICMQALINFATDANSPLHGPAWAKGHLEHMRKGFQIIHKLGGTVAIGTDAFGEKLIEKFGTSAKEIELLVELADFTPMEAIMAATKNAAKACFMGDKTGTLEAGKLADILVVDGDPIANIKILQDSKKIKMVMLEGKVEFQQ